MAKLPRSVAALFTASPVLVIIGILAVLFPHAVLMIAYNIATTIALAIEILVTVIVAVLWMCILPGADFILAYLLGSKVQAWLTPRFGFSGAAFKILGNVRVGITITAALCTDGWVVLNQLQQWRAGTADSFFGFAQAPNDYPGMLFNNPDPDLWLRLVSGDFGMVKMHWFFDLITKHLIAFGIYLAVIVGITLAVALCKGFLSANHKVWNKTK